MELYKPWLSNTSFDFTSRTGHCGSVVMRNLWAENAEAPILGSFFKFTKDLKVFKAFGWSLKAKCA